MVALALLWGVGSLSPARAADPGTDETWTGLPTPPHTGTGGGAGTSGGSEGDPDWWQTDVWTGAEVGALPVPASPQEEASPSRTLRLAEDTLNAFVDWLLHMGRQHLGF